MIQLSELAHNKIKELVNKKASIGLRVAVKTTGCSGLAYVLEYIKTDVVDINDEVIKYPEFIIKINKKDLVYVNGSTINWVKNGLNEGFEFSNPNERDKCGCGESFRV